MTITGPIPNHILNLMDCKDRLPLGKAGVTSTEAQEKIDAKSEKDLQNLIAQYLRQKDIPYIRQAMNKKTTGMPGWPDFCLPFKGNFFAIECKVGANKLSQDQEKCKYMIEKNGGIFIEARTLKQVLEELK